MCILLQSIEITGISVMIIYNKLTDTAMEEITYELYGTLPAETHH